MRNPTLFVGCFFLFFVLPVLAKAGDFRPLCEKVAVSDLVFEAQFQVKGAYPKDYKDKGWPPPESELKKIVNTGKVLVSFKGDLKTGAEWQPYYAIPFRFASEVWSWENLFKQDQFSMIVFLQNSMKTFPGKFKTTGWAEESAGCKWSAHYSWCPEYANYIEEVKSCLNKEKSTQ